MATKKQVVKNEEINEESKPSKTKKIATGNTKKVVQKRSSSVAAKVATQKKETSKVAKQPKEQKKQKEEKEEKKVSKSKGGTSKKVNKKLECEGHNEVEEKAKEVVNNKALEETANEITENNKVTKKESSKGKSKTNSKKESAIKEDSNKVIEEKKSKKGKSNNKVIEEEISKKEYSNNKISEEELSKEQEKSEDEEVKDNNNTTALTSNQIEEIKEVVKNELKANKKMPKEQEQNLFKKLFQNIGLAIIVLIYFNFIVLGFINIKNDVFLTDIKIFSMAILIIAIVIFEFAYKKESGRLCCLRN